MARLPPKVITHPVVSHILDLEIWRKVALSYKNEPPSASTRGNLVKSKILYWQSPFFWKLWFQKGIKVLGDLYDEGTKIIWSSNLMHPESVLEIQYLQFRHLLLQNFGSSSVAPPRVDIWSRILDVILNSNEKTSHNPQIYMGSWFQLEGWNLILRNIKTSREIICTLDPIQAAREWRVLEVQGIWWYSGPYAMELLQDTGVVAIYSWLHSDNHWPQCPLNPVPVHFRRPYSVKTTSFPRIQIRSNLKPHAWKETHCHESERGNVMRFTLVLYPIKLLPSLVGGGAERLRWLANTLLLFELL